MSRSLCGDDFITFAAFTFRTPYDAATLQQSNRQPSHATNGQGRGRCGRSGLAALARNDGVHFVPRFVPSVFASLIPAEQAAAPHCGLALRKRVCYEPVLGGERRHSLERSRKVPVGCRIETR